MRMTQKGTLFMKKQKKRRNHHAYTGHPNHFHVPAGQQRRHSGLMPRQPSTGALPSGESKLSRAVGTGCLSPCPAARHRTATRRSASLSPLNSGSSSTALCWIPTGRRSQWHSPMCRSRQRQNRPHPSRDSRCPACN